MDFRLHQLEIEDPLVHSNLYRMLKKQRNHRFGYLTISKNTPGIVLHNQRPKIESKMFIICIVHLHYLYYN